MLINYFLATVPEEVSSLQFDDVSDRSVRVVWTPPNKSNGILRGYTVIYMMKDKPETTKVLNFTSETQSVRVEHLQVRVIQNCLVFHVPLPNHRN